MNKSLTTLCFLTCCFGLSASAPALADAVMTKQSQADMSTEAALTRLKAGNQRFVTGKSEVKDYPTQVEKSGHGQFPFAAIVTCLDSRTPPEIIFDQNIGDIFVGRIAGNFVDDEMLGSLEFATALSGAKLIVVMGHTHCGAIKGACDHVEMGNLTSTLSYLKPALQHLPDSYQPKDSSNEAYVQAVADKNVELQVEAIKANSKIISKLIDSHSVKVVGAMYDINSGKVQFFEPDNQSDKAPNSPDPKLLEKAP